ncbi:MAG: hypothetical protein ABR600_14045 [Actinomycetota bacterium]
MSYEDPGWRPILKGLGFAFIPYVGHTLARRSGGNLLENARTLFTSFVVTPLVIAIPLAFVTSGDEKHGATAWALGVTAFGLVNLVAVQWVRKRPLVKDSPDSLAQSYVQNMILGIAFAEAPALLGFVGATVTGAIWVYPIGAVIALIGMLLVAPTRWDIERRQSELRGSSLLLGRALIETRRPSRHARLGGGGSGR